MHFRIMKDGVAEVHSFVFCIFYDKGSWNRRLVLKSQRELFRCINFGQTQVDNWLHQVYDWPSKVGFATKTCR